jgi:sec-independent protein translocase protein TatB
MFDIGFWELSMIAVVALLVIGPERLPKVAKTAGFWFGRVSRFLSNVKADIDREMKAEELKKIVDQQAKSSGIHEFIDEGKEAAKAIEELDSTVKHQSSEQIAESTESTTSKTVENTASEKQTS